jgi:hypothetical protein
MSKIIVNGKEYVGGGSGGNYYLNTIYSTEEKKVGYWADNKPLYQKSFVIDTSNLNTGWNDISSGLSGIDCKDITGKFRFPANDNSIYEFPYTEDSNYCLFGGYKPTNDMIFVYKGQGFATISDFVVTLRYTKNTDTADPNPQFGNVIYLPSIYSDEEREVGVWRDGKPLYQRTFDFGSISGSSSKKKDLTSLNIDYIASFIGTGKNDHNEIFSIPFAHTTSPSQEQAFCRYNDDKSLGVYTGSNVIFTSCFISLQYTKTTDVAGSGTWNSQGGIAHHYSTSEKVIGTWIDGKPIYEKTFTNVTGMGGTQLLTNVDTVVDFRVSAHGTGGNSAYHCIGDGFTINSSKIFMLTNGVLTYGSWTSSDGEIEKDADFIVVQYTKTTDT